MADEQTPGTPMWWLSKLHKALRDRTKTLKKFDDYFEGNHPLTFATQRFREAFGSMFLAASDNWMPLIVDAVQERLAVQGFRLGDSTAGDKRIWRIWQDNNLDAEADVVHTEALINGEAYTLTWFDPKDDKSARITVEHPTQMIVVHGNGDRRVRLAALKVWQDEWENRRFATLYLPDFIYKYRTAFRNEWAGGDASVRWVKREVEGEQWPLPNPLGVVPVVAISNARRMLKPGESELRNAIPLQDKINKLSFDMMIASEFAAYRQRWATGLGIPKDPTTGQPVEEFKAAVDRMWTSKSKDTTFGSFEATDLSNYVKAIELQVQHLAAQTRTPPHYLLGQSGAFPSGESLKATETGLIAKVKDRSTSYGEGWEETMRLALQVAGIRVKGGGSSMETQWSDPESRTESEHVDSVLKKLALGVPMRQLWEDLGYTQAQISRFAQMLKEEAAMRPSSPPAPPADTADGNPVPPEQG